MKATSVRLLGSILLTIGLAVQAEEIRDYYSEPGLHPFKETVDQSFNESIDPFGGVLQLKYTDLVVPGNGGLDININRVYTSLPEGPLEPPGTTGLGWTMHFGRIVVPIAYKDRICAQSQWSLTTRDNPSLEHPDGSRELLVLRSDNSGGLITKSNWKFDCAGADYVVTAPNGTVYRMNELETLGDGNWHWLPNTITDVHGNTLSFTYGVYPDGIKYLQRIDASDGRLVTFEYVNEHLSAVVANEQRIEYHYQSVAGVAENHQYLTQVVRPDMRTWTYTYNPMLPDGSAGSYSLTGVTYPYGATIAYTYQHVYFQNNAPTLPSVAVSTKTTGGRDVTPGSWTYTFAPGSYFVSETGRYLDETTVDTPLGQEIYRHYGYLYSQGSINGHSVIGLLRSHEVYENGQLRESRSFGWDIRQISIESYWHGRDEADQFTWAPVATQTWIQRDGYAISTNYSLHDEYGNPTRIERTSNALEHPDKVTTLTYHNDSTRWIIGLPKDETLAGIEGETVETVGTISRIYSDLGELLSESRYGVETRYTYTPQGDLATRTDALTHQTTYSNYHRGIAQREEHPESVVIERVVNDTGTVASETNGRSFRTSFAYDGLNRLTSITYPRGNPVAVEYSNDGKTLTRGNYVEAVKVDGFGNTITLERRDSVTTAHVTLTSAYDALNRKIFQSYPNSTDGDTFTYDVLGRTKSVTHQDGTQLAHAYTGLGGHAVTDENEHTTRYFFVMYGDTEGADVIQIVADNDKILTKIRRNLLGQPKSISQGEFDGMVYWGYERTYTYDAHYYLDTVTGPEIGDTVFMHDLNGNMTSKQVGTEPAVGYVYDDLNRLENVNYPTGTPSVATSYDANGNVKTVSNGIASMSYVYDENDNLTHETITIGTTPYAVGYDVDGNDSVRAITYPSTREVQLEPDALGRPTKTGLYVTQLSYHPTGQVESMTFANGKTTSTTLDPRMRTKRIHAAAVADLTYNYDGASNILGITDAIEPSRTRTLTYDAMNRLDTATGAFGNIDFDYDGLGNIKTKTAGGAPAQYGYQSNRLNTITTSDNVWGYAYDNYGNVRSASRYYLPLSLLAEENIYTYNHAGQLVLAEKAQSEVTTVSKTFGYDGNNQRVSAVANGKETHYVYSRTGILLGEYSGSVAHGKEHIYVGSQIVATVTNNVLPAANAGLDAQVASGGTAVLDGSASTDPDGQIVGYLWEQIAGPIGQLLNATSVTASYLAPPGTEGQTASFRLTVTDNSGEVGSDTVNLSITNPPVANAGLDQTVLGNSFVTLDASGSGGGVGTLSYAWTPIDNSIVLSNSTTATPSFTAPAVSTHTTYGFSLRVTDASGLSSMDTVNVLVLSLTYDSDGDKLPDAWEFTHFGSWALYDGASDPDGDGIPNSQEYAEGTSPAEPAPAPTQVQTVTGRAGVTVTMVEWQSVPSAMAYKVYWSTTPNFDPGTANVIADARSPVFHEKLTNETTYYYSVVASNNSGDSPKSVEVAVTPRDGTWQSQVSRTGNVIASNARGEKVVLAIYSTLGGQYQLDAQRYHPATGWTSKTLATTDWNEFLPHTAINGRGDIVVTWTQRDAYGVMDLKAITFAASSGSWSATQTIALHTGLAGRVLEVGDLVLRDERGVVAWSQEYAEPASEGHVFAKFFDTNTKQWSATYRLDANGADGCGDSGYRVQAGMNAAGAAAFGWARCGVNVIRGYLQNGGLQPQIALQTAPVTGSEYAFDLDVNAQGIASVVTLATDSRTSQLQAYEFDVATNTLNTPRTLRQPRKTITRAFTHLSEDGKHYAAWEESGTLYALRSETGGDVLTTLGTAASKSTLMDIQSLLGRDQGHVVAWRTGGNVYVSRYDWATQTWATQLVSSGASQYTAIGGIGHIDTLYGGWYMRSYAPAP